MMVVLVAGALASGQAGPVIVSLVVLVIYATSALLFGRLTVEVEEGFMQAAFGWGWPQRRLDMSTARAARIVRNRWWYGFGIRWSPKGSLWNVWGLDAVEFDLESGRVLRIGTDEPEVLLAAVTKAVPAG